MALGHLSAMVTCCCCSVAQSYTTLCDPTDCSMPGFPVHHQLLELAQTQVHQVSDAIQPSSVFPSSSCLHSFPASGSFPMSLVLSADTPIAPFPEHACSAALSRSTAFPISAPVGLDGGTAHSVPSPSLSHIPRGCDFFFSREKLLCYPCKAWCQKCQ